VASNLERSSCTNLYQITTYRLQTNCTAVFVLPELVHFRWNAKVAFDVHQLVSECR
jgi:hypothetical protein